MIGYVGAEEQVDKDFHRALLKASLRRLRDRLRKDSDRCRPVSFDEAKGALAWCGQAYSGIRPVEVEKITGSVGRYRDFDASFLPLKKCMGERWGRGEPQRVSPERRALGPAATALGTALKAPFCGALAAEIAWLALSASAKGVLSCVLGAKGQALAHLCSSSEPSPSPRTCSRLPGEARQRLGRPRAPLDAPETPYALVLFGSLFFGIYAFFGWCYSP